LLLRESFRLASADAAASVLFPARTGSSLMPLYGGQSDGETPSADGEMK